MEFALILNPPSFSHLQSKVTKLSSAKPACSSSRDLVQVVFLAQSGGCVVGAAWVWGCLPDSSTHPGSPVITPQGSRVDFRSPVVHMGARQLQE